MLFAHPRTFQEPSPHPMASCLYGCPVSQHCVSRRLWYFVSSLFVLKNRWQWWSPIPWLTSVSAHLPWWPALLPDWWISPDLTRICCPHRRKSRKGFKKAFVFSKNLLFIQEKEQIIDQNKEVTILLNKKICFEILLLSISCGKNAKKAFFQEAAFLLKIWNLSLVQCFQ